MNREFRMPEKVRFGADALSSLKDLSADYGTAALLVTGHHTVRDGIAARVTGLLQSAGIRVALFDGVCGEPTDRTAAEGLAQYQKEHCDFFIAVGGGSAIDTMKAIAVLSVHPGPLSNYIGREIPGTLPPMIAVPTTAGTGSEATRFTIITDTASGVKMLLQGNALMPRLALLDPSLTVSAPKKVTAASGLDALTHCVEAYTSKKANSLSDTFALSAVRRIFHALPHAYRDGSDLTSREEMLFGAFEAGVAFNNSSVTLIHGMSRPIGALFHVPHGISNAMLLKVCLRFALDGAYERFGTLGRVIGAAAENTSDKDAAQAFLTAITELCALCEIPTIEEYGIDRASFFTQIDKMTADAMASGSPSNTAKPVDPDIIKMLYTKLWEE